MLFYQLLYILVLHIFIYEQYCYQYWNMILYQYCIFFVKKLQYWNNFLYQYCQQYWYTSIVIAKYRRSR